MMIVSLMSTGIHLIMIMLTTITTVPSKPHAHSNNNYAHVDTIIRTLTEMLVLLPQINDMLT